MNTDLRVIIYEDMIDRNIVAALDCGCRMKVEELLLRPQVCHCLEIHFKYDEMPNGALVVYPYEARFAPARGCYDSNLPF